jgi:cytochrome c-type biogenesis protein
MVPHPTLWLAFAAGLLSFLSPCVLPLYPSYLSYITGITFASGEIQTRDQQIKALIHTLFFVLGFAIVFFALGMSATLIGQIFIDYRNIIRVVGGILIMLMGLVLCGSLKTRWLMMERKWHYRGNKIGYLTSILIGVSFAAGWTPCIGPILASVLVMAATQSAVGVLLILAYIIGFAVPFVIFAFAVGSAQKLTQYGAALSVIGGYLMVIMGALLASGLMSRITVWFIQLYGGFTGF